MAQLLLPKEAAERLRITTDQLKAFGDDGEIRYINVSRGKKRERRRYTDPDLDLFVERRARKGVGQCQSINQSERRSTPSTSRSEVIGFTARLNAERDAKLKKSKC